MDDEESRTKRTLEGVANARLLPPGTYYDTLVGNLYLRVRNGGKARSWYFRYMLRGRIREIGLGSLQRTPMKEARRLAQKMHEAIGRGEDPATALPIKHARTFADVAKEYIEAKAAGWSNPKHRYQWSQSLSMYAFPVLGPMLPREIKAVDIVRVLRPIWEEKTETATRVRQRVEAVLDYAAVHGLRDRNTINPAAWRGNLAHLLPAPAKVQKKEHQRAIPYDEVADLYAALMIAGTGAKAAAFALLTAARSGEARNARWSEIQGNIWTIPASRMKARRPHSVPLSDAALTLLESMRGADDMLVFPSPTKPGQAVSDIAVLKSVMSIREDSSVHGLRATFRTWAAEKTNHPREVVESALAHVIASATEAAYQRGDLMEKRRRLMDDWAQFVTRQQADVIPMNARATL